MKSSIQFRKFAEIIKNTLRRMIGTTIFRKTVLNYLHRFQKSKENSMINRFHSKNPENTMLSGFPFLAAGEGFEPSQTESESGVLPLHKPAMLGTPKRIYNYMHFARKVKLFFRFLEFFR